MTTQPFPFAPEPTAEERETGRLLFTGPIDFLKGVVAMDGMPPPDRLEVCFAGRSNVGKSSLINALTGRKNLARASNTPGRTQEINYFALGEMNRFLVDLPGYGYAAVAKNVKRGWQDFLWDYLTTRPTLAALVRGADAVVNLVGILNESGRTTFERVHADLTRGAVDACRAGGVRRLQPAAGRPRLVSASTRWSVAVGTSQK